MIALALLLAAAAPASPPPHVRHPAQYRTAKARGVARYQQKRFAAALHVNARCVYTALGGCAKPRSPYRLADDAEVGPDYKLEASAVTGGRCGIIGAKVCPRHPRKIIDTTFP